MKQITGLTGLLAMQEVLGFAPSRIAFRNRRESKSDLQMANEKIGIFFGTSTGGTETVASVIASEFGNDVAAGPFEIDTLKGNLQEKLNEYDCLLVGTPTWNTGADTERSGTGWDEMYYSEMQNLKIEGKKVAVFGLGDSESYCDNYADASGELHDVFESLGCNMHGYTSQDGYEHEESKAIRGENFCGLLLDVVNQDDLTEERVKTWVSQLKQEGFLETDSSQTSANSNLEVSANSSPEASDAHSDEKVGVFFGTSTGGTETVATAIASELGKNVASGPFEIDSLKGNVQQKFDEYDCLVVGTPTWNTGADTERSGTGWDEIFYSEMQNLKIQGKKVAVFGLGDSESYCDNYADASGELHDVFESLGCAMHGYTSQDGYEHEESKAIRGDKFCGLLLDVVNQNDLTEGRVKSWVSQLKQEGFLGSRKSSQPSTGAAAEDVSTVSVARNVETQSDIAKVFAELEKLEKENAKLRKMLEKESSLQEEKVSIKGEDENGFVPHFNPKSGRTMWISPDGRTCYFTTASSEYKP